MPEHRPPDPIPPEALLRRAQELDRADLREEARLAYGSFLEVEHGNARAWADYGGLLLVMDRLNEAEQACQRALEIEPELAAARVNQAGILLRKERVHEAEFMLRHILTRDPRNFDASLSLADCFLKRGDLASTRTTLERLLKLDPANERVRLRLNNVYIWQGDWAELRKGMERQLEIFNGAEAEYERSHLDLLFGEMPEGWLKFEARLQVPHRIRPARRFETPRWTGDPFPECTLLVHWEQGFGDTLMFLRYLPRVKALGGKVVLMVQPELVELAATCAGPDVVIPEIRELPPHDFQVSLLSLPAVFRTSLLTIPAEVPYLDVPSIVPNRSAIAGLLAGSKPGTRIGLVWAGNPNHKRDAERSIPVEVLAPLDALPDVAWYSFQLGCVEPAPLHDLISLAPLLGSFSDTAYALSGMDLVLTVDTAAAHLAGAMGIPTLLLVAFQPDFRWLLGRSDSPWYPTMQIYRQPSPGDWTSVIQQLLQDLGGVQAGW